MIDPKTRRKLREVTEKKPGRPKKTVKTIDAAIPGSAPLPVYTSIDPLEGARLANVPKVFCDYLKDKARNEKELFDYGFRFMSYLIANAYTREDEPQDCIVTQDQRKALAKVQNTDTVTKRTRRLQQAGIIELVQQGGAGARNEKGQRLANTYRIPSSLFGLLAKSEDLRAYASPAKYRNREKHVVGPTATQCESLHSFEQQGLDGSKTREAVADLQQRALHCDLKRLRMFLAGDGQAYSEGWQYIVAALHDGPNYATYRLASSGRLQTRSVNLQGVPRRLRKFFYPSREGYVFLDLDYRSQEPWIVAHLSQDQALMSILSTGDLYQHVQNHLSPTYPGLTRDRVKAMVNSYNYGAGLDTLARAAAGLPDSMQPSAQQRQLAEAFRDFMGKSFPDASRWTEVTIAKIRSEGRAEIPGWLTREGIPADEIATKGVNHVVQGMGAQMLHLILARLDAALGEIGYVVLPMHDGILLEVRRDRYKTAERIAKQVMEDASREVLGGTTSIPVEATRGWKEKSENARETNRRPPGGR